MKKQIIYASAFLTLLGAVGCSNKGYETVMTKLGEIDNKYVTRFDNLDSNYAKLSRQVQIVGDTCNKDLKKSREINRRVIDIKYTLEEGIKTAEDISSDQEKIITKTDSLVFAYRSLQTVIEKYGETGLVNQDSLRQGMEKILEKQEEIRKKMPKKGLLGWGFFNLL